MRRRDSARSDLFGDVGIGTLFGRGRFSCGWVCSWAGTRTPLGSATSRCYASAPRHWSTQYHTGKRFGPGRHSNTTTRRAFIFFGRKIGTTATIMRPFSSTFGWIKATPRQPQRPHVIGTGWVSRRGTDQTTRRASVLFSVAFWDFCSLKK
jgi:hypothetical protein